METAAAVFGTLVVLAALVGFVRSLWRPPGKRGSDGGEGTLPGESVNGGGHGGADGGSH
jgi:hypothetical protein